MLVSVRCIAIGCNVFFLPVNEWQHFRHKRPHWQSGDVPRPTELRDASPSVAERPTLKDRECRESNERGGDERAMTEREIHAEGRAATSCPVQWRWGLHMISIKHLEALVIYYWQMQKGYISQTIRNEKKKPTNTHNEQAMLLHNTKAPLSQICLNFWQQRKLNNMAFFFF